MSFNETLIVLVILCFSYCIDVFISCIGVYCVRHDNMLQHMVNGTFGSITFSIVSPFTRSVLRVEWRAVGQTTAQRFIAISIRPFLVIRIEMGVGQMKNFELRDWFLKYFLVLLMLLLYYLHTYHVYVVFIEKIVLKTGLVKIKIPNLR